QSFQVSGGPGWLTSEGFDIIAKPPQSAEGSSVGRVTKEQQSQVRQRLQALLAERFQLMIRRETKEMQVYSLGVARNGPKLLETDEERGITRNFGLLTGNGASTEGLTHVLASILRRPVLDRTGLSGNYKFQLEWA